MQLALLNSFIKKLANKLVPISLLAISTLLALYITEFFCSQTNPFKGIAPKVSFENGQQFSYGRPVYNNSMGFREREIDISQPKNAYRVMVLGDSFSWGYGIDGSGTYAKVAEQLLRARYPNHSIEILNFSLPGLTTSAERDILKKYSPQIKPDLVVIGFCFNDPLDPDIETQGAREEKAFFEKYAYLFKIPNVLVRLGFPAIATQLQNSLTLHSERQGWKVSWLTGIERSYQPNSRSWSNFEATLKDIRSLSALTSSDRPLFAVLNNGASHSEPPDFDNPTPKLANFILWWDLASKAAAKNDFQVYDHINEIKTTLARKYLGINAIDWHPSEELHHLYGVKLAQMIEETNGLKKHVQ